ncbi:MAG: hypothetical protein LUG12_12865 [Erysipelotrichaceae bacterium]|nr:hypothetical protein [Erysipelotrichaceae bacterium]
MERDQLIKTILEKWDKEVIVITQEDEEIKGVLWGMESFADTTSGEDEIELYMGRYDIGIPFSDIKDIVEIQKEDYENNNTSTEDET